MSAFLVVLRNKNKLISVRDTWVKNPIIDEKTIIFYSPNDQEIPDFDMKPSYFFNENTKACYEGRIVKRFDSIEASNMFLNKRSRRYIFNEDSHMKVFQLPEIVESVELSDDDFLAEDTNKSRDLDKENIPEKVMGNASKVDVVHNRVEMEQETVAPLERNDLFTDVLKETLPVIENMHGKQPISGVIRPNDPLKCIENDSTENMNGNSTSSGLLIRKFYMPTNINACQKTAIYQRSSLGEGVNKITDPGHKNQSVSRMIRRHYAPKSLANASNKNVTGFTTSTDLLRREVDMTTNTNEVVNKIPQNQPVSVMVRRTYDLKLDANYSNKNVTGDHTTPTGLLIRKSYVRNINDEA
ncbi:uncharacterized protein LOC116351195 [Contarinia nasturtii]|uniref:uncharacterized protein LOC116351195 n=1 Tax=Contarinia nasturtii TaxID=265458 RepID=UPI0012D39B2E|nr:uncharacterized protein LOC116351195 [Contarinia nasturtii]